MSDVGFTGTSRGMTVFQMTRVKTLLIAFKAKYAGQIVRFHEGDCVGADAGATAIAKELGFLIACHPPLNGRKRARVPYDLLWPEKEYLERNHDIVDESKLLIATPEGFREELRSGTWATVRYARRRKVPVELVFPYARIGEELS